SKQKQIYIQDETNNLGFTLIKPILKKNKLIAFFVIDYSQKTYNSLTSLLSVSVKIIIVSLIVLVILLTVFILYFLRNSYIRNRMYRNPNSGTFYRSYLTDNYEKINFLDYYISLADIDFFKQINDIYGQVNGDKVLNSVMQKISSVLKKDDIFIQYGGEEFLLLISKKDTDIEKFKLIIENIRKMVESLNIKIKDDTINITISIGAFIQTNSASSLQDAIQKADGALYDSKHNGRNIITYFDISDKMRIYREKLKDMIESDKLICFYQPITNLKTREIHHYEALLRIEDGDDILSPDQILPNLENSYFYSRISMKVIEYNIDKLLKNDKLKISLNLSSDDLINDAILALLRKNSALSDRMLIEILETKDANYIKLDISIQKLKLLGYKFCIDDYGAGYSNLNHLLHLSIDYLKIDGSIIKNIDKDKKACSLIRSLNLFCKNNGIKVVAEFIENKKILEVLIDLDIEYGQGYYFDKPKPYNEI
ncbi:MAG TPA: bifunctional diguanylate cyclase/phosphodiesterase, partial [Campylobacterales bacterium]|nr:bifunctional diguanylate cyclase/phosphodiesterase [Campylobacterales bacterium]